MKRKMIAAAACAAILLMPAVLHAGESTRANSALLSAAGIAAAADGDMVLAADGDTSRSEWLPEFSEVYVSAAIDIKFVQVPQSEAPRIVCDTHGAADTKFKAFVDKRGVLNITERILRDARSRTTVEVYYHSLTLLDVSDAYVSFGGTVAENILKIEVSGGAKLSAEVDVADLEVVLSGRDTRAKLTGRARYLEIEASSGLLDASALESMSVDVVSTYGAGVAVRASERLKASASTSATISYRGTPTIIKGRTAVLGGSVTQAADDEN